MYQIFQITEQDAESVEQLGTKPKFWYRDKDRQSYLFKESRLDTGEHWAEKVACELCELVGILHAQYELAYFKDKKGVICLNFVPSAGELIHGNELLVERNEDYPMSRFYRVKEHTVESVLHTVDQQQAHPPIGWSKTDQIVSGTDVFVGYLMIDAWIANQDRHHENWGLIRTKEKSMHLAPSYDHASSLGRNESDEKRKQRLTEKGRDGRLLIESYIENAYTAFYASESSKRLKTIDAFKRAADRNRSAGKFWLNRLSNISDSDVQTIFRMIPTSEITDVAIEFAQRMLTLNKTRLLEIGANLL